MEIQTYKDNIREYTQHSTTNNNVIITTIMPGTHYWQAFFTKQQMREPWQRMPCVMGPGKKWTYTTIWEYKNVKTIYENTLNINVTAPTWEGDLNCSKWGPDFEWNGDQKILTWILFKMYFQPVLTSNFWKAEGRLELEPASAFSDKREDPKISALRLKLEPLDARRQNWPSSLHNKLWRNPDTVICSQSLKIRT